MPYILHILGTILFKEQFLKLTWVYYKEKIFILLVSFITLVPIYPSPLHCWKFQNNCLKSDGDIHFNVSQIYRLKCYFWGNENEIFLTVYISHLTNDVNHKYPSKKFNTHTISQSAITKINLNVIMLDLGILLFDTMQSFTFLFTS